VTATFDGETGAPQPLPERYVPEAYREWGVEISDWQTQCSVDAGGGGGGAGGGERWLRYASIVLLFCCCVNCVL
jgi:hypothetical protein